MIDKENLREVQTILRKFDELYGFDKDLGKKYSSWNRRRIRK